MSLVEELRIFAKGQKLLIVEDDSDINAMLVKTFGTIFDIVKSANNGFEAFNMYNKERFDIIISDISMPLMNGIELAKNIKKINKDQHIIIASAHSDSEYLIDLIDIGIDSFILKPIKFDKLLYKIGSILENKFYQKELQYLETSQHLINLSKENNQSEDTEPKKVNMEQSIYYARKQEIAKIRANTKAEQQDIQMEIFMPTVQTSSEPDSHISEDRLSAKAFMSLLQEDELVWFKIKQDVYDMVALTSDLDEEVNYLLLNGSSQETIENIVQIFLKLYNILIDIPKCGETASLFLEIYERLNILDYNEMSESQKKSLDLLEYLFEDVKNYIYNVFVDKGAEDINIYYNLIKSDIEQITVELTAQKEQSAGMMFF